MPLRRRLGLIFLVTDDEWPLLLVLAAVCALLVAGIVIGLSVSNSVFMQRVGGRSLPLSYIVTAAVMLTVTPLYLWLVRKLPRRVHLGITWCGLGFGLLLLRPYLHQAAAVWVFLVYALLAGGFTMLAFSALCAATYDPRQARRLLPIVGAGGSIGAVVSGAIVPAFVAHWGTENLALLWAACLFVAWLLVHIGVPQADERPTTTVNAPADWRAAWRVPVTAPLAGISGLMVLVSWIVGYQFNLAVKAAYPTEADFASYFALVAGAISAITLAAQLFLVGRVLRRLGVVGSLLAPPALLMVPTLSMVGRFNLVTTTTARSLDQFFQIATLSASLDSLSAAIPTAQRDTVMTIMRAVINPLAMAAAGAILIATDSLPGWVSRALIPLLLVIWMLLVMALRRRYLDTLLENLSAAEPSIRLESLTALSGLTEEAVEHFLRQALASGSEESVVFALQMLRTLAFDPLAPLVRERLNDPSAAVRTEALLSLTEVEPGQAEDSLWPLLQDADVGVRMAAISSTGRLAASPLRGPLRERFLAEAVAMLERETEPAVCALILRSMFDCGYDADDIMRQVATMLTRPQPGWRLQAAGALPPSAVLSAASMETVWELLRDPDAEVRRCAAMRLQGPYEAALVAALLNLLRDATTAQAASVALASGGSGVVAVLRQDLAAEAAVTRALICEILGHIASPEALESVLPCVGDASAMVRKAAVSALAHMRVPGGVGDLSEPLNQSASRLVSAAGHLQAVRSLTDRPAASLLAEELEREMLESEEALAVLMGMVDGPAAAKALRQLFDNRLDERARAIALELVDASLRGAVRGLMLQVLEKPDVEHLSHMAHPISANDLLAQLQQSNDAWLSRLAEWTTQLERSTRTVLTLMEKVLFLRQVELFRDIPGRDLLVIAEEVEEAFFQRGSVIFQEGESGDALYLVTSGSVAVLKGDPSERRIVAILGERECFGEMSILTGEGRSARVETVDETRVLIMRRQQFRELIVRYPHIAFSIFAILAQRLKHTTEALASSQSRDTREL